jgi:carbon storage regulator CsrA
VLVLTGRVGESIILETSEGPIQVTLLEYKSGTQTSVGIEAPESVRIWREELAQDDDSVKSDRSLDPEPQSYTKKDRPYHPPKN